MCRSASTPLTAQSTSPNTPKASSPGLLCGLVAPFFQTSPPPPFPARMPALSARDNDAIRGFCFARRAVRQGFGDCGDAVPRRARAQRLPHRRVPRARRTAPPCPPRPQYSQECVCVCVCARARACVGPRRRRGHLRRAAARAPSESPRRR